MSVAARRLVDLGPRLDAARRAVVDAHRREIAPAPHPGGTRLTVSLPLPA